jgi:RNA polymerase sigma-70 factor (ECF subfamily)
MSLPLGRTGVAANVDDVIAPNGARSNEMRLLQLARAGDERAFGELVGAYRAELRAHCYRIMGSVADAEDALQEGLLRAWRGLHGFEGRGSARSWLYAIVTNAALDLARSRARRELPVAFGPSASPGTDPCSPLTEQPWLDPYPDHWLAEDVRQSPEARYEQRESVELAFMVALHHLPALQRAVLLLREVVGFSTAEIASQLGTTAQAVNSALQRARAAVRSGRPARSQQSVLRSLGDRRTRAIVQRYSDAIENGDADTLISMLTADATWSMPPVPTWYDGHEAIRQWLVGSPLTYRWQHRPTRANGQLAVGCYLLDPARNRYVPAVLDVLTLDGAQIAAVTAFLAAEVSTELPPEQRQPGGSRIDRPEASAHRAWITGPELFARFGLPDELPPDELPRADQGEDQTFARR